MASDCLDTTLLLNSGTSQAQRQLEALLATYVSVDERTDYSSLILFAKKYGAYLNFYSLNNIVTGDWQNIMGKDVAVALATVGTWNTHDYSTYINNLYTYIATPDQVYNDPTKSLRYLFDLIASITTALNQALTILPADDTGYLQFLTVSIGSKVAVPLAQLIDYYSQFNPPPLTIPPPPGYLVDTGNAIDPNMPVSEVTPFTSFLGLDFWKKTPWAPVSGTPVDVISIPISPAGPLTPQAQIINSSLFKNIVSAFMNGIGFIVGQTEGTYIQDTLINYPNHAPQYALFLAFLRLLHQAQDHLNHYTGRHLEFYYKKVLQLTNAGGVPDDAHLVFQLQKNTPSYLLAKNTQLKAGKDATGNDLFYALTDDAVLNQSSVSLLKSLYLSKNSPAGFPQLLYASPQANTSDGNGGKLTSPDQSWYPFGDLTDAAFTAGGAKLGFAIASNLLYLNEGTRRISLTFNCTENLPFNSTDLYNLSGYPGTPLLSIQFTGNKKWFNATDYPTGAGSNMAVISNGANGLIITTTLSGSAPPIIPYSSKIHGGSFPQSLPMVQVLLDVQAGYQYYDTLKALVVSSVTIEVSVDSVQNLVLQNKDGKIDPSKPFKPFGEYPPSGSPFIFGSKEIFQKKLKTLTLNMTWQTTPANNVDIDEDILIAGQWAKKGSTTVSISGTPATSSTNLSTLLPASKSLSPIDFTASEAYGITSVDGFVRLLLTNNDYDLASFINGPKTISVQVTPPPTTTSTTYTYGVSSTPAMPPAAPVATAASVYYDATDDLALDATAQATADAYATRQYFFYHIEPFGYREMHPYLLSEVPKNAKADAVTLLPVFDLDDGNTADNGGELWVGLSNTQPGETQSILFQVAGGTANPQKNTTTVDWYYMSANNWIQFDLPIDQTNNLSQSGLVVLNLQGDETTNNTRADAGLLWIKAMVGSNTDAVCKIIAVLANAAKVQFVQTAIDTFTTNIPEKTISKLAVANGVIKQVTQPYPSFGGKPVETNPQFQQRVSERLRHKNRAVTPWDYERLVLQNFPQVHKVKCLNHTTQNVKTMAYSELKPGSVMVITLPDLSLVTGSNPLLPFTDIGLLDTIKKYLEPLTSPFVHLEVCNPQFEGVELVFCVTFINGNANQNYYEGVLNEDIGKFMMPWAYGSEDQDIEFGGKIEKSVLLSFVQKRPYVDYVTGFKMNQYIYGDDNMFTIYQTNVEEAIASTARSILVPYSDPILGVNNTITSNENCNCNG